MNIYGYIFIFLQKNTRSLDTTTTTATNITNNNNINRTFKPILSLDSGKINKSIDFNNDNGQKVSGSSDNNDTKPNINGIIDTESTGKFKINKFKCTFNSRLRILDHNF